MYIRERKSPLSSCVHHRKPAKSLVLFCLYNLSSFFLSPQFVGRRFIQQGGRQIGDRVTLIFTIAVSNCESFAAKTRLPDVQGTFKHKGGSAMHSCIFCRQVFAIAWPSRDGSRGTWGFVCDRNSSKVSASWNL